MEVISHVFQKLSVVFLGEGTIICGRGVPTRVLYTDEVHPMKRKGYR